MLIAGDAYFLIKYNCDRRITRKKNTKLYNPQISQISTTKIFNI